jgi:hypothetical protein
MKKITIFVLVLFSIISLSGCFLAKKIAGADIDNEQFDKAREAKVMAMRAQNLEILSRKLEKESSALNFDLVFSFSQDLLNRVVKQYDSTSGWFDNDTKYFIKNMNLKLVNGSAIVSIGMLAKSSKYNVDVDLITDCMLSFEISNNELALHLEPFNISPNVKAGGMLSSADELIKNLIKINLANLEKSLPQMKFPLVFNNKIPIRKNNIELKDKVNMAINIPESTISYKVKLKDVLCLSGSVLITMNIENVEVK